MSPAEVELAKTALRELDHHYKPWIDAGVCALGGFAGGVAGFYLLFLSSVRFPRLGRLIRQLAPH